MTSTRRLSSGLRISSSLDDPSGLAIAEKQQAMVNGLDTGAASLQDANNALNIADGAMQTMATILQRMRALVVEANSTILSSDDLKNTQAELDQLRAEIDKIAQNTTFNGKTLLDGSCSSQLPLQSQVFVAENATLASGNLLLRTDRGFAPSPTQPGEAFEERITVGQFDPTTGLITLNTQLEGPGAGFGPTQTNSFQFQPGADVPYDPIFPNPEPTPGNPTFSEQDQGGTGNQLVGWNSGHISAQDTGQSAMMFSVPSQVKANGTALQVNAGAAEGNTVSVDIPAVNSRNLGVNEIVLGDTLADTAAEYRIDYGIQTLANARAQVGAQTVALQETITGDQTASDQSLDAESAIRDANIGTEMTSYTRDQLLVSVQMSLLSSVPANAGSDLIALVRGSAVA